MLQRLAFTAILAIFTGTGITKRMYEDLRNDVKWEQDRPAGVIFHVASVDSAGNMHVADVWESQQQLDEFLNKRLIPVMKKRNIPPPRTDVFQIHNINAYAGSDKYKLK